MVWVGCWNNNGEELDGKVSALANGKNFAAREEKQTEILAYFEVQSELHIIKFKNTNFNYLSKKVQNIQVHDKNLGMLNWREVPSAYIGFPLWGFTQISFDIAKDDWDVLRSLTN